MNFAEKPGVDNDDDVHGSVCDDNGYDKNDDDDDDEDDGDDDDYYYVGDDDDYVGDTEFSKTMVILVMATFLLPNQLSSCQKPQSSLYFHHICLKVSFPIEYKYLQDIMFDFP